MDTKLQEIRDNAELSGEMILTNPDLRKYFHSVKDLLRYYRYYSAYCANAVDAVFFIQKTIGLKRQIQLEFLMQDKLKTLALKQHIDSLLAAYKSLCCLDGNARKYRAIELKFLTLDRGGDGKGKPYSTEWVVEQLEREGYQCVSERTIKRDLKTAYKELKVVFFGIEEQKVP